ncbi:MAG: methyltransferase domain-containing protein [Pseudomonadota bacterium]|nr:methyltransferase domain-containing protein [Pseudomonadota bacterium]
MAQVEEESNTANHWKFRSSGWTQAVPEAQPLDDVFNRALVDALEISPNDRVLDLAAGTGEPSISIANSIQKYKKASIIATDLTIEMLEIAKKRADLLEFSNIKFAVSQMEALPFRSNSFDKAVCRMGLMFPADKIACAKEAQRVLKIGGLAAYLCWGELKCNPAFELFAEAMRKYFKRDFPLRLVRHSLGEPGALTTIMSNANFENINERIVNYERAVKVNDPYFKHSIARSWPAAVEILDDEEWGDLLKYTQEVFSKYRLGDKFLIPNSANLAIGLATV